MEDIVIVTEQDENGNPIEFMRMNFIIADRGFVSYHRLFIVACPEVPEGMIPYPISMVLN